MTNSFRSLTKDLLIWYFLHAIESLRKNTNNAIMKIRSNKNKKLKLLDLSNHATIIAFASKAHQISENAEMIFKTSSTRIHLSAKFLLTVFHFMEFDFVFCSEKNLRLHFNEGFLFNCGFRTVRKLIDFQCEMQAEQLLHRFISCSIRLSCDGKTSFSLFQNRPLPSSTFCRYYSSSAIRIGSFLILKICQIDAVSSFTDDVEVAISPEMKINCV